MVVLQFNSLGLLLLPQTTKKCHIRLSQNLKLREGRKSYAINIDSQTSSISETTATTTTPDADEGPPVIDFAFVNSRLLPDGSPDVQYRSACGGQKLRDIMLENHVELYGPYARPLLNCGGGGTCGTCIVEVVDGNELLSPKTPKEKEKLKKQPKKWRLACQTVVGKEDSRGESSFGFMQRTNHIHHCFDSIICALDEAYNSAIARVESTRVGMTRWKSTFNVRVESTWPWEKDGFGYSLAKEKYTFLHNDIELLITRK